MSAELAQVEAGDALPSCRNCASALTGPYCSACGQKDLDPHEYAVGHFLHHALHDVTHFDTKLFRSIVPLLAEPGRITADYLDGRRGPYMRPLQTFILLNLIFFLFAPRFGLFRYDLRMFENGRALFGVIAPAPLLTAAKARTHLSDDAFRERFDSVLHAQRKALVIVMVVLFAIVVNAMFRDRKRYFVEHLIFALHFYSFWLIVIIAVPLALLGFILLAKLGAAIVTGHGMGRTGIGEDALVLGLFVGCTAYLAQAVRRVYGSTRGRAWFQGAALSLTMLLLIAVYRDLLFFTTVLAV
jgi:hypothetical protein